MDGLECCEISLASVLEETDYFRLEAEYYNAKTFSFYNTVKAQTLIKKIQYGTSKVCCEEKNGYPVLRLNELRNCFIEEPSKYCHILSENEFEELRLYKNDVVIIRTNGNPDLVGRAAIVMEDTDYAFASYLFKVNINSDVSPSTLVAFLNGKYGRMEIDKNSMKGNQTNFSPAKFRDINIPVICDPMQKSIDSLFSNAYNLRLAAKKLYRDAQNLLSANFNDYMLPVTRKSTVKKLSESFGASGRLDAEFYQSKYDKLFESIGRFNVFSLGGENGLAAIRKSIEPGSEYYQKDGIPFIRVSDVNTFEISMPDIKVPRNIAANVESLFLKKDTILFSKDGSVGIAYKVQEDMDAITSGALLHLTVKNLDVILPDYLTLVLNSPIVQMQAERDSNGAVIRHWKPSDVAKVIIPVLDMDVQKDIAQKIQESFELRKESKRLLEIAIKAVELAIETDEKSAVYWLESQV